MANETGIGLGYAYRLEDDRNTAFTIAVGRASDETAIQGSIGWEFGGSKIPTPVPVVKEVPIIERVVTDDTRAQELERQLAETTQYVDELERRLSELESIATAIPPPEQKTIIQQIPYLSEKKRAELREVRGY